MSVELEPTLCRQCEKTMETMPGKLMLRVVPRAVRQCPACLKRVLLYVAVPIESDTEATGTVIIKIWSDEFFNRCDITAYAETRAKDRGLRLIS